MVVFYRFISRTQLSRKFLLFSSFNWFMALGRFFAAALSSVRLTRCNCNWQKGRNRQAEDQKRERRKETLCALLLLKWFHGGHYYNMKTQKTTDQQWSYDSLQGSKKLQRAKETKRNDLQLLMRTFCNLNC